MIAHSAASFGDALTYLGMLAIHVPVSHLIREEDPVIPEGRHSRVVALAEQESREKKH